MSESIPSIAQCLALMDRYGMLDNIRAHSLIVARVAEALLTGMKANRTQGTELPDPALVLAGALLHDIAKTICLNTQCDHARKGRDICMELGYPIIGDIVREHVRLKDFSTDRYSRGIFLAKELVYYADKRVRHDTIVSLDERMAYIIERYGNNDQQRHQLITENFQRCRILEHHLFFHVNFTADELATEVSRQSPLRPQGQELQDPFPGKGGHLQK
jgi:putative nucleotidyltransferase with HDIG domain